jgi:hypothetical protein
MLRTILAVGAVTLAAAAAACSGSEPLSPAPTTDHQTGGGSIHNSDTAIVSGPQKPPPPLPPVVASFALSGTVYGHEAGVDTTRAVAVPNATVALVKIAGVEGDTLVPSVSVASTTTDGQGAFRIENLPPAYYRIDVTAPAGSPFQNTTSGIGPARENEMKIYISLTRKP